MESKASAIPQTKSLFETHHLIIIHPPVKIHNLQALKLQPQRTPALEGANNEEEAERKQEKQEDPQQLQHLIQILQ